MSDRHVISNGMGKHVIVTGTPTPRMEITSGNHSTIYAFSTDEEITDLIQALWDVRRQQ